MTETPENSHPLDERPSNKPQGSLPLAAGSPIPEIDSAYLNLGGARSDALMAEDAWENENWPDALMWIDEGIRQLSSARAKIERHVASLANTDSAKSGR